MLNEFYNFIAKRINRYFQTISSDGSLLVAESFCLKLDDDDMVLEVTNALKSLAEDQNIKGVYQYICRDGSIYETFTLKLCNDEIIIASQINGMTNDFLCATLRNAANDARKPLLMISSNLIDSAKSGSRDMSSNGMPFHPDELMKDFREMVKNSTQLTDTEKSVLRFELSRREADVFSDKSSLYEYKDLLSIMDSGSISVENYQGFRLFPIDGKSDYHNFGSAQIDKIIKENHSYFERIDKGIQYGDLELVLAKDFESSFIARIERAHRDHADDWSTLFKFNEILSAIEKKKGKQENPLNIETKDISMYGDIPLNSFEFDKTLLIRNEGSQTGKKRTKNIIAFNSQNYSEIHFQVNCNTKIAINDIKKDDTELAKTSDTLTFKIQTNAVVFHKIEICDSVNDITYIFKLCVISIPEHYLLSTIRHCFSLDIKSKRSNSRVKLSGIGTTLVINPNASELLSMNVLDNETYSCSISQRLLLCSTEDDLINSGNGIKIDINFSGVLVPFTLIPDEPKKEVLTGKKVLREKFANKQSFQFDGTLIFSDSQDYFANKNLLRELLMEKQILDKDIICGSCRTIDETEIQIENIELNIPETVRNSYNNLLKELRRLNTVPTLAYIDGKLFELVNEYLSSFEECFSNITDGKYLTKQQEDLLLVGSILVGKNCAEVLYTPLHPLNLMYQLELLNQQEFKYASDVVIERLNSINLLPYIQRNRTIYKVSEEQFSREWKYYAPLKNRKYRGSRKFVSKLVEEKINEFISNFRYIFDDINNRTIKINLINMGDCSEVFIGIANYFVRSIGKNANIDNLIKFDINIYSDRIAENSFTKLKEYSLLKDYLNELNIHIDDNSTLYSLEGIMSKNVECYFHRDNGKDYSYSHISFYEMESKITSEQATMSQIETGLSLDGILSGIPSSKYGQKYRTGFGMKYVNKNKLTEFACRYNSLMQVETSGNPYYSETGISTQIDDVAENKMSYIYNNSNWVVFVDPKVDLDFFCEKEANSDLLIIHYSDQYTSSSGYDAITVTHKSQQYAQVIQEYLKTNGVSADPEDVHKIINLFNAVNGAWLLRLVSSKKSTQSTFSREKISIVAAIKFMLAFLKHPNILWIPISLEEMLRVSGGAGLSKDDGILSVKNLGFDKGPTSDDLLFIGLNTNKDTPVIYLYPTEVKTGNNDSNVITKAFEQVSATATGLNKSFNLSEELISTILYKVNRNFLMQLLVNSCKKMKVYHVDDSQNWDTVLDIYRTALLNEQYFISNNIQEFLGRGAVLSFRKTLVSRKTSIKEESINFIEMPENDQFDFILKNISDINAEIFSDGDDALMRFERQDLEQLTGDLSKLNVEKYIPDNSPATVENTEIIDESEKTDSPLDVIIQNNDVSITLDDTDISEETNRGMNIIFGTNEKDGSPVIWCPNDTSQLFHTNTGIIGTMGTGKTQFTKSLITQLYREQCHNVDGSELGILIFDYKGDYNESKEDFVKATNAKILKPYHLPFNPLALTKSKVFKPLLPIHTANAFKDTISKVYGLGPKQQDTLFQCIIETYSANGITPANKDTWDNSAPTFEQVYQRYANDEDIKKNDSLAAAMNKLHQFEVFESDSKETETLFDLLKGVVVVDLSGYDSDIQSLIIAITLDLFYAQMQASGSSKMTGNYRQLTKLILVDEADNFMSEGFPALKKILKEGREFGVGTILSTQFLKHFGSGEDDYAKYILTWVVHNVSDLKNSDVEFVFKTEQKNTENMQLYNAIKGLTKHKSIVKMGNCKPVYVNDKAFWQLYQEIFG